MKKISYLICAGMVALGATAFAAKHDDAGAAAIAPRAHASGPGIGAAVPHRTVTAPITTQRSISRAPFRTVTHVTPTVNRTQNHIVTSRTNVSNQVRTHNYRTTNQAHVGTKVAANRNVTVNRNRNVAVTNNYRNGRFTGQQYAAFRNYHRQYHNRGWYRSHYNRVVFVGGGWYFWDAGYWYPAWGYDPYAYYPYDGPIYGYNDLAPDQIVSSVQAQLQRDGYYAGPIDGQLGPLTRQAIAAFQADHGLAVTSSVDEPTLQSLGLT
jgi:hypothetical protein